LCFTPIDVKELSLNDKAPGELLRRGPWWLQRLLRLTQGPLSITDRTMIHPTGLGRWFDCFGSGGMGRH